jgi:hypothetical protein
VVGECSNRCDVVLEQAVAHVIPIRRNRVQSFALWRDEPRRSGREHVRRVVKENMLPREALRVGTVAAVVSSN